LNVIIYATTTTSSSQNDDVSPDDCHILHYDNCDISNTKRYRNNRLYAKRTARETIFLQNSRNSNTDLLSS